MRSPRPSPPAPRPRTANITPGARRRSTPRLVGTFSARFKQVYGITRDGNVHGPQPAPRLGNPAPANEADEALLAKQRDMLLAMRDKRTAPFRDERVMPNWNGLVIAALARAGIAFDKPEWIEAAIKAFDAVVATLGGADNTPAPHARARAAWSTIMPTWRAPRWRCGEVTGDAALPGPGQGLDPRR